MSGVILTEAELAQAAAFLELRPGYEATDENREKLLAQLVALELPRPWTVEHFIQAWDEYSKTTNVAAREEEPQPRASTPAAGSAQGDVIPPEWETPRHEVFGPIQDLKKAALYLASQGVPVFPCCPETKAPFTENGYKDASTDARQIKTWWTQHPRAIIGMPTGRITNCYVIDIDSSRAEEELALLAEQNNGVLPRTYTVKTHRGKQLYFQYSGKPEIGCSSRNLPQQVDVRGDGGYVIVPPSPHPKGGHYEVIDDAPKAELPLWLFGLLVGSIKNGEAIQLKECTPRWAWQHYHRVLAELRRAVPNVNRNNLLNRAAWWAGRLSGHPRLAEHEVAQEVKQAARATELPDHEIENTWRSGWEAGLAAKVKVLPIHECTDLGNADRFVLRHGNIVRCVPLYGEKTGWLVWDGHRWKRDSKKLIRKLAHETVRAIYLEAAQVEDDEIRKRLVAWAVKSESDGAIDAMLKEAQTYVAVEPENLDADPELLNLENGTLDLRTGEVCEQRPSDLITRMLPVRHEPRAACPLWKNHLEFVLPDPKTRDYFQEAVAYHLSGSTAEQCVHILLGDGENGKSTTDDVIRNLAGDYGCVVKREFFATDGYGGIPPHDVADLQGRRIATCSEFEEGDVLRISLMKALTSGQSSKVRGCHKYGHPFEFYPQVKFLLDSNYPLKVDSPDHGTWRRIRVIPFTQVIPADKKDRRFADKLWAERSGILNWIILGLKRWNTNGRVLAVPDEIKQASEQYKQESDLLAQFIEEQCVVSKGQSVELRRFTEAYQEWARRVTTKRKAKIGERAMEKRLTAKQFVVVDDDNLRCKVAQGLGFRELNFEPRT